MAAEWEPAIGTLITWPLSIPHKLVIELAKDNKLYTLIADRKAQQEAIGWFTKWGITPDRVRFIAGPQGVDASWTRDWGPHALFSPDGTMKLADARYKYSTPVTGINCNDTLKHIFIDDQNKVIFTTTEDQAPEFISNALNLDIIHLPFTFTGGNVITDGQRSGFSTCALTNENRFTGVADEKFLHDVHQILGIQNHHIISNFEDRGIQHIDCFMKLLDEERMLVMRPPVDHPAYEQYEGIVKHELSYMTNAYGRPYQILRLDTDRFDGDKLAAYSNSLILNKVIYVPLFNIPQDSIALDQWRNAMPGYTVKGFEFDLASEPVLSKGTYEHYKKIGWSDGDALHCRTRAVWDPAMLYISVDRLPNMITSDHDHVVRVIIKDYSGQDLKPGRILLKYKYANAEDWHGIPLAKTEILDQYKASVPHSKGRTIEYYIEAESNSGKTEMMPRTAPEGYYAYITEENRR